MLNEKKNEIITIIKLLLQVNIDENFLNIKEFQEFMINSKILFLKIIHFPESNRILLQHNESKIKEIKEKEMSVTFYKLSEKELSFEKFFTEIDLSFNKFGNTLISNELEFNIIPRLKLFFKDETKENLVNYVSSFKERIKKIDKKLKLEQLQSNPTGSEKSYDLIFHPTEEIDFWKSSKLPESKLLNPVFSRVEKYFLESFLITSENINDTLIFFFSTIEALLFDLKSSISADRVKNFLEISLESFNSKIMKDIISYNFAENTINSRSKIFEYIRSIQIVIDKLTSFNKEIFSKQPLDLENLNIYKLFIKLNEIYDIKNLVHEVNKLIPESKLEQYLQDSFKTINLNNQINSKMIDEMKDKMYKSLSGVEEEIIKKLKKEVFVNEIHVLSVLREMQSWKGILGQTSILEKTKTERVSLITKVKEYIENIKASFDKKSQENFDEVSSKDVIIGTSEKISWIIWAYTLKQKLENIKKMTKALSDLQDYKKCSDISDDTIDKINTFIKESIGDWKRQYQNKDDILPKSWIDILEIDPSTSLLKLNFSEKLFTFLQDIRNLIEFGYASQVKEFLAVNEEGKKIYKEAISLKQIANFYNSLSSQVIKTQKPMLVQSAKRFESNLKFLSDKSKLKNEVNIENFVFILQNAANDLNLEIRKLKKAHSTVLDYLCQLLNYDLINSRTNWKDILKKARKVVDDVCAKYNEGNVSLEWKNHWNFQLYKVLKIQYSIALERFYSSVPDIPCQIMVKNKSLEFSPSIEDLKVKVLKEVRSLISLPSLVNGFSQNFSFTNILGENVSSLTKLYLQVNDSINKIDNFRISLLDNIGLIYIDHESYIRNNFKKTEHWETNLDLLKLKKKEIEKLEDTVKIDCFKINLINYKSFLDDISKKFLAFLELL